MSAQKPVRFEDRRTPLGRALLVLPVVLILTAAGATAAVFAVPVDVRMPVGISAGSVAFVITIAVTIAAGSIQSARNSRAQMTAMHQDAVRLADEVLPALVARMRGGSSMETALAGTDPVADGPHQRILRTVGQEINQGERRRAAAMSVCATAASRVQALATTMLAELRDMEERHDEEVLGDLLKIDHTTAQAGRLADSIAVLTGARTGRRWSKPIVMESILRGAVGRIDAYQRVRVHSTCGLAVVGNAAEGVMHTLAELMDNATSFSPPSEQVHVYVEEVQAGVVIAIEDGGLVMSDVALRRAEALVSAEPLDLTTLSGTRLGLAVVGCLARKHGLTVFFRPSSRGGTGVVVMIPRKLLTEPKQKDSLPAGFRPQSTPAPGTAHATASSASGARSGSPELAASAHAVTDPSRPAFQPPGQQQPASGEQQGLPKRRRGETLAAASAHVPPVEPRPTRGPTETGAKFGAFRRASRSDAERTPPGEQS